MQTTKIIRLPYQKPEVFQRLKGAQMEAAQVWVDAVFMGNPDGVRTKNCGKRHNQRMAQWEYGKDLD
jgi:hypothetical protein